MSGARVEVESGMSWSADGPGSVLLLVRAAGAADQSRARRGADRSRARASRRGRPMRSAPGRCASTPRAVRCGSATARRSRWTARSACARATTGPLPEASELAFDLLPWILPSRYATSDALAPTADASFGEAAAHAGADPVGGRLDPRARDLPARRERRADHGRRDAARPPGGLPRHGPPRRQLPAGAGGARARGRGVRAASSIRPTSTPCWRPTTGWPGGSWT